MDLTNYPGTAHATVNTNYEKNPQQTIFLNAKMVGDTNTWPGVGHGFGLSRSVGQSLRHHDGLEL